MSNDVLTLRKATIGGELDRLRKAIAEYETELAEIEAAERVIARYAGAERPATSAAAGLPPKIYAGSNSQEQPSVTEMIKHVLRSANRQGLWGLEPAAAYEAIVARGWKVNKDSLRAAMWKMSQAHKLVKSKENPSLYGLPTMPMPDGTPALLPGMPAPQKNTTADAESLGDQPAVVGPSTEAREAGRGGGA